MSDGKPSSPVGSANIEIRGKEYMVFNSAPPPGASIEDLKLFLERNRNMLKKCQQDFEATFIDEVYKRVPVPKLNYDSPIQQALTAHRNVQILLPILQMRGEEVVYEKMDILDPKTRVERMLAASEKAAHGKMTKNEPFTGIAFMALLVAGFIIYILLII